MSAEPQPVISKSPRGRPISHEAVTLLQQDGTGASLAPPAVTADGKTIDAAAAAAAAQDHRLRTLSTWARGNTLTQAIDRRAQKMKRWQTLPIRPKNRASMSAADGVNAMLADDDGVDGANAVPSWNASLGMSYSSLGQQQKNEVDLSIAALQNLVEGFIPMKAPNGPAKYTAPSPSRVRDQILNVIYLLQKFQVDSSVNAALRESNLRRLVSQKFVNQRGDIISTQDREVAQWISENVFAPTELRRLATDTSPSLESAKEFYNASSLASSKRSTSSGLAQDESSLRASSSTGSSGVATSAASRMQARRSSVPPFAESSNYGSANSETDPALASKTPTRVHFSERQSELEELRSQRSTSFSMEWGKGDESKDNPATQRELDRIDTAFNDVTVVQTLRTVDRWDFDIFTLAGHSLVGDSPLLIITTHLFNSLGLFEKFSIPLPNFANFISRIERGYKNNAYHNRLHAADVVQNMFFFLRTPSFSEKISPLDVFAALIAAAVHDVGHPGTNNAFQILTNSELATAYNDRSVLENFHLAEAFRIMKQPDCDIFVGLPPDMRKEVRESIIVMVLATDMQVHLHVMSELQTAIETKKEAGKWFDSKNRQDALLCLKVALHCADVANPTKPLPIYKQWVDRLVEEWYLQGDAERRLGLPVSPLMDRTKPNVAKSQVGFIDFFIRPLFETWLAMVPESKECMDHLLANRAHYDALAAAANPPAAGSTPAADRPAGGHGPSASSVPAGAHSAAPTIRKSKSSGVISERSNSGSGDLEPVEHGASAPAASSVLSTSNSSSRSSLRGSAVGAIAEEHPEDALSPRGH